MKRLFVAFVSVGFFLVVPLTVSAACSPVALGGTGQCTFTQGLLYSAGGTNPFLTTSTTTLVAGTNISFGGATPVILGSSPITISSSGGGGGTGNVSTSTHETAGQIAYWTSTNGTPALLGQIATSTLTASSPLTGSLVQIGSGGSIGCQTASGSQAGCLSSANWTTFNNKGSGTVTSVTVSTPNSTLTLGGTNPVTTSGTISADLNLAHVNTWTATQTFDNGTFSALFTGGNTGFGTTTPDTLLMVEGSDAAREARIQRDVTAPLFNSVYGTYDVDLNEASTTNALADGTGPAQTFGVRLNGGTENLYADISALRNGADTTGELVLRSYVSGTPIIGFAASGYNSGVANISTSDTFFIQKYYGSAASNLLELSSSTSATGNTGTSLFSVSTTGSTTAANGFNITAGCFAVSGTCITQNAGTVTSVSGTTNQISSTGGNTPVLSLTSPVIFPSNFEAFASSTIGDGTATGGLTINGNSTTSAKAYIGTSLGIGFPPQTFPLDLVGGSSGVTTQLFEVRSNSASTNTGTSFRMVNSTTDNSSGGAFQFTVVRQSDGSANVTLNAANAAALFMTNIAIIGATGNVGIASSTPWARFSVNALNGDTNPYIFIVASSTAAASNATTTPFAISRTGWIVTSGVLPTASSCGSTNSVSGNQTSGTVMFTGTLVTTCTITFPNAVPSGTTLQCTESDNSLAATADISATTTSSVTFGLSTGLASGAITWDCDASLNSNG